MDSTGLADFAFVTPMVTLAAGAFLLLLGEHRSSSPTHRWSVAFLTCIAALILTLVVGSSFQVGVSGFGGIIAGDTFTWTITLLILAGSVLSLLLMSRSLSAEGIETPGEFYSLFLMTTAGALLFVSSTEFITLFVALEIMSMGLYCLTGSSLHGKGERVIRSSEGAVKYFLLGSFASAFFLYGIAMTYGLTGSTFISEISARVQNVDVPLLGFALGLTLVGLMFKIGAVPFHFWAPDVYEGAPTPVTAYMACVVKLSAVAVAMRVLWQAYGDVQQLWTGALWFVAAATMIVGNLIAVRQRNVKRMLAYSSIAHAGYLCAALLMPGSLYEGGAAIVFYMVGYTLMTTGAFAVVQIVSYLKQEEIVGDINSYTGLGYSHPMLGLVMSLFLLSLAGLPPGMVGLAGKFYIFSAIVRADYIGLAVIGVLSSAVSCYYYLRVIVAMYFHEAEEGSIKAVNREVITLGHLTALSLCGVGVILFGVFPGYIFGLIAPSLQSLLP
jgi:NADH-quinone oxidoreductase subunit N